MKCPHCKHELVEGSDAQWIVGGRRNVPFRCVKHVKGVSPILILITLPDEVITNYEAVFIYNNKEYWIASGENGSTLYGPKH